MPIPQLRRRVYGYLGKESKTPRRETRAHGELEEGAVIRRPSKKYNPRSRNWGKILFSPLILSWYLLRWLWRAWQKRPRLSQRAKKRLRAKLGFVILTGLVFIFLGGTIMIAWASKDLPDPDKLTDRKVAQSTKIYDRAGRQVLYEVYAEQKRTLVGLEEVPRYLLDAVIATEDADFYQHRGIRLRSFARALFYGLFTGKRVGGTSTLTQQLVKNAILTNERSLVRKLKEIILSLRLEQKYSKEQILQIYFNEIPYGSTNYGVQSAARGYFGKDVSELNLQEAATLAGLPQAPTRYLNDSTALKQRRDFVLRRMFEEGFITEQEKIVAQNEPITLEKKFGEIKAPHFVLYVKQQLVERYGEQTVDAGGLKVITTLDWEKQQIAETVVAEEADKRLAEANADNVSLVALDPKTGQILALVGSRDFYNDEIDGQFNVATLGRRQPGSSFKPIVYAAAFDKGYTPDTILWDVFTNFAVTGKPYEPRNYDLQERGPVTMRQALQGSLNIPAVKTLYLVGPEEGVKFAGRFGYTTLSEGNFGLSLVLGGGEVKLLEHTAAYGVLANNGVRQEPISILRVEEPDGGILYEWKPRKGEKVLEEKITATVSNILSDDAARAYIFGAGGVLTLPDRPVAAKTGTTNNYVDAWTIGYTPSLVAGVWVGRTDNKPMNKGDGGSRLAAPIWQRFMKEALTNTPAENFSEPPANDADKPILRGSTGGGITLRINKITGKIAVSSTPEGLIAEKTYLPAHSILHYVKKDDPRGSESADPSVDPQYAIWEAAIQDWIQREKEKNPDWQVSFSEPPTEYDDYSPELLPKLEIVSPAADSVLNSRRLEITVKVSAPRGVAMVSYQLDGKNIGVARAYPFGLDYYAPDLADGPHLLSVVAEDDLGGAVLAETTFILAAGNEPPNVWWLGSEKIVQPADFPLTLFLNHFKLERIAELKIYQEKDGAKFLLLTKTDFSDLFNNQILFSWSSYPGAGEWQLIVEIKLKTGETRESGRLKVEVE